MYYLFLSRWTLSKAKKDDTDETIAKYDGKYDIKIQSALEISNTDISKYPFVSNDIIWIHALLFFTVQFLLFQTTGISK